MKFDIKVISTEKIPPSSPTPNDVSNYKLSFIDQSMPRGLIPWTLFYKANVNQSDSEVSIRLKKSLSKTLSLYYPLAGRVVDNLYVDCNDQGIVYVEARADCTLSDAINEPIDLVELNKLNPNHLEHVYPNLCVIVQTTFFNCGGLAIGVGISHKLCDAHSFSLFANSWAAISRGADDDHIQAPIFNGAKLFPPKSDVREIDMKSWVTIKEDIVTKRFIFTASKINDLRDKYAGNTTTRGATRIEALSALIWTRLMASTTTSTHQTKDDLSVLLHLVNFRKRVAPPLSDESFGNFIQPACVVVSLSNDNDQQGIVYAEVVQKLKKAIQGIGGSDYADSITSSYAKNPCSVGGVPFAFSSYCRFPLYEADFGWGKPIWVGTKTIDVKNIVWFFDSPNEGSIEAWLSLKLEDMAMFEADEEVLAYAKTT